MAVAFNRDAIVTVARNIIQAIEPWYDWGRTSITRIDNRGEGPGRFFDLQWAGLNITIFIGRTPKREG
ncbi:hypothetical protein [Sphingomonas sp. PP-CC-3G-468]|uniref:hypothetical protein n=1 Tax=Sphingomonas sp. PP-CC-3G-468 TaxID=2135656 RepID=UPI001052BAA7|nr:hypothetical protein [Sphingomonas sp. PP-CC-3G-468]TCM10362.1 hypothetical protein C8J41_101877 [Sphingomonas sp. PP-CC-3G-468]